MRQYKYFIFLIVCGVITLSIIGFSPISTLAQSEAEIAAKEAQLKAELAQVERQIAEQQKILAQEEQKGASFQRDINILNAQIKEAELKIRAHALAISALGRDINAKTETIKELEERIERNKVSLAQLLRKTNEIDNYTLTEIILANRNISDFFSDLDVFESIKESMKVSFEEIRGNKRATEVERDSLDEKRLKEIQARISVETEQKKIQTLNNEKKKLLSLSVQEQQNYKSVIADQQKRAAQIRAALFALRDTAAIPFGTALEYANAASAKTGVRPAFILGILTQESNLGQNVGSCVITNLTTGETKGVNSGTLFANGIHPTRDLPLLQVLLAELGRDPLTTKVSCPLSIGYGGAMGPAQFIPSTWNAMKPTIAATTGKAVPDPWNPQDAIMASALFLRDLGAAAGTFEAEKNAACRYYSGRVCSATAAGNTYGSQVMAKTQNIQVNMIDPLKGL